MNSIAQKNLLARRLLGDKLDHGIFAIRPPICILSIHFSQPFFGYTHTYIGLVGSQDEQVQFVLHGSQYIAEWLGKGPSSVATPFTVVEIAFTDDQRALLKLIKEARSSERQRRIVVVASPKACLRCPLQICIATQGRVEGHAQFESACFEMLSPSRCESLCCVLF